MKEKGNKKVNIESLIRIIVTGSIIASWFWVTTAKMVPQMLLPSPKSVWDCFLTIVRDGYRGSSLMQHFAASMARLVKAYLFVILLAVPLGLLSGYYPKIRALIEPIIEFYRPLPPLAYYTLLVLWMGIGDGSKIMLLFLAGFAPAYIACMAGVKRVREDYILGARTLGARNGQIFFYVLLPAALPDIFTGLRTALGVEYTTLVAAEMIAAVSGIGWMVLDAANYMRSDIMFLGIIIMGITGIFLDQIVRLVERKIIHWKGKV